MKKSSHERNNTELGGKGAEGGWDLCAMRSKVLLNFVRQQYSGQWSLFDDLRAMCARSPDNDDEDNEAEENEE